ncbi:FumA C-terminus/TtdB family hydratase beta subunit [Desulfonatronospira sp. MSAO_Bac3]|uniref:FumA C-terminus/TtdB family hydratase beta subunit n=1 Tax=Desulfonatronospira sp. MSAO_Bac3 TaxID=2293857 RepID=UPI000FEFBDF0|nr:FumA C-terminus/TtdB family hydratase beta subunit [Desulfonatronospira sp. MSAO_Bac3]RQD74274.1 MAG: TRZ/ATZ family protein [Desulfonatronospira sp. MSAO_Bac3]
MSREIKLSTPLQEEDVLHLRTGDKVLLSGHIYTARDAAHKRLLQDLDQGIEPPFNLQGAVVYYVGPTPAPPGRVIGSAGPTTSSRMDAYTPRMHQLGVRATIGKGRRSQEVRRVLQEQKAVYLGATGGAGALLSRCITGSRVLAFEELGTEAIRELEVLDFPLLVVNDAFGGELYVSAGQ